MSAHEEAVEFINLVADADSSNRMDAIEDLKFVWGEQWPAMIQNSRTLEERPCLTINETETYVRHAENQIRQQRPRIKSHPVGNGADVQEAEIITGYIRHVEEASGASHAYDWASAMPCEPGGAIGDSGRITSAKTASIRTVSLTPSIISSRSTSIRTAPSLTVRMPRSASLRTG